MVTPVLQVAPTVPRPGFATAQAPQVASTPSFTFAFPSQSSAGNFAHSTHDVTLNDGGVDVYAYEAVLHHIKTSRCTVCSVECLAVAAYVSVVGCSKWRHDRRGKR
jgi:hypothetical protein